MSEQRYRVEIRGAGGQTTATWCWYVWAPGRELVADGHDADKDRARGLAELVKARLEGRDVLGEVARLRALLHRDRTGLAEAMAEVCSEVAGWSWLGDPEQWGSIPWDQRTEATLRENFAAMRAGLVERARSALGRSGNLAQEAHEGPVRVDVDKQQEAYREADALVRERDAARAELERVKGPHFMTDHPEPRQQQVAFVQTGEDVEPGTPIVDISCPCCGAELEVTHGDDEGEVAVVGSRSGSAAAAADVRGR